jgi:hypothetical protein
MAGPLMQQELLRRKGVSIPAAIITVIWATVVLTPAVAMMDVQARAFKHKEEYPMGPIDKQCLLVKYNDVLNYPIYNAAI